MTLGTYNHPYPKINIYACTQFCSHDKCRNYDCLQTQQKYCKWGLQMSNIEPRAWKCRGFNTLNSILT